MKKERILTGFRPTGELHIGHFSSMIEPLIEYTKKSYNFDILLLIADLHALTELRNETEINIFNFKDKIKKNIHDSLKIIYKYIKPDRIIVFKQSDLMEYHYDLFFKLSMIAKNHCTFSNPVFIDAMKTELTNKVNQLVIDTEIKNCIKTFIDNNQSVLTLGFTNENIHKLNNMLLWCDSYKKDYKLDKSNEVLMKIIKHLNNRSGILGFASYSILMAADIMLYRPTYLLVGKDQLPHLQITNDLIRIVNSKFNLDIKEVNPLVYMSKLSTIKGNDGNKMSKSMNNCISIDNVISDYTITHNWFMKMKSYPRKINEIGNPDDCVVGNMYNICGFFTCNLDLCKDGNISCLKCKEDLFEMYRNHIQRFIINNTNVININNRLKYGKRRALKMINNNESLYPLLRSNY